MMLATTVHGASKKQVDWIADMAAQRDWVGVDPGVANTIERVLHNAKLPKHLTPTFVASGDASDAISALLRIKPRSKVSSSAWVQLKKLLADVPDGRFALPRKSDGVWDFFEVVTSRGGGRFVNQLLGAPGDWNRKKLPVELQAAVARAVGADWKSAAVSFAERTRTCSKCGAELTHPRSLAAKIGKKCAGDWGWPW